MSNVEYPFFDAYHFKKLNYDEWLTKYKSSIRVAIKWSKIKKPKKTGVHLVHDSDELYLPWYNEKNGKKAKPGTGWMDGKPVKWELGKNLVMLRLPAIKILKWSDYFHDKNYADKQGKEKEIQYKASRKGKWVYLVPDGCHRLTELKPSLVILDWVQIREDDKRYFYDFYNEFWRE